MDGFIDSLPPTPDACWIDARPAEVPRPAGTPGAARRDEHARRARDIPNYWAYADHFTLEDHMFAPVDSWTLPSHLFLVSGWSAVLPDTTDPMSCRSDINLKGADHRWDYGEQPIYAWTDVTWLLDAHHVSWRELHRQPHVLAAPAVQRSGGAHVRHELQPQRAPGVHELLGRRARRGDRQRTPGRRVPDVAPPTARSPRCRGSSRRRSRASTRRASRRSAPAWPT